MSQFNRGARVTRAMQGLLAVQPGPPTLVTGEGAPGYKRDAKSELFLLAAGCLVVNNASFYETELTRNARFKALVHEVALADPQWLLDFLCWLRGPGNMRTAPMVAGLEGAKALVDAKVVIQDGPTGRGMARTLVDAVLHRADEPGEALAYWLSTYGKKIPKPVKRGIADAINRVYKTYGLTKYDTASKGVRFGDVIELTHPSPPAPWKSDLYKHAIDRRHGRATVEDMPATLIGVTKRNELMDVPVAERRALLTDPNLPARLAAANMTWEALAGWLQGPMDAAAWQAIIPNMGYMALLRNLRNFDEQGIDEAMFRYVSDKLCDVDEVMRGRQFPFRYWTAFRELSSLRWGPALEKALGLSVGNIPALEGVTRILVDTSASMRGAKVSKQSTVTVAEIAALFGVALAQRNPGRCKLYGFADGVFEHPVKPGAAMLVEMQRFNRRNGEVGHGTDIVGAIRCTYQPGDARVIVISDMQTMGRNHHWGPVMRVSDALPASVPLYGFTLNGEEASPVDWGSPNRIELGGMTDATFRLIPTIEAGVQGHYPWMTGGGDGVAVGAWVA